LFLECITITDIDGRLGFSGVDGDYQVFGSGIWIIDGGGSVITANGDEFAGCFAVKGVPNSNCLPSNR